MNLTMLFTLITAVAALITEIGILLKVISPIVKTMSRIVAGTRCQLRTEMLRIYYRGREQKVIRQYEYENFVMSYEAYKALKGNSFIDEIYEKVQTWEIIS